MTQRPSAQELAHGADYVAGSPHLRQASLRDMVTSSLRTSVLDVLGQRGTCRVLDVGAGHGDFTDVLTGVGAHVTVTEMSRPSATLLADRYKANRFVDVDGDFIHRTDLTFDMVVCESVLHHIPDYGRFISAAVEKIERGGAFISWQDPLRYPRRHRLNLAADRAAYLAWRVGQGEIRRVLATRWRRLRGVYDESNPSDMSEYHVVRQGVDEAAIAETLKPSFRTVDVIRYWSTQSTWGQALGSRAGLASTFGVEAVNRI